MTEKNPAECQLRNASLEDTQEATELLRRLGLIMPDGKDAVRAHWKRLWIDNPAMTGNWGKPPLGWVLEKDNRLVGFFGNIPLLYYYGKRRVIVADASQWGVEKEARQDTQILAESYFNQPNAEVLLVTTAI